MGRRKRLAETVCGLTRSVRLTSARMGDLKHPVIVGHIGYESATPRHHTDQALLFKGSKLYLGSAIVRHERGTKSHDIDPRTERPPTKRNPLPRREVRPETSCLLMGAERAGLDLMDASALFSATREVNCRAGPDPALSAPSLPRHGSCCNRNPEPEYRPE